MDNPAEDLFKELWPFNPHPGEPVPQRWNERLPSGNYAPISWNLAQDIQTLVQQIAQDHPEWLREERK